MQDEIKKVTVIGGGIAGIQAALDLAEMEIYVDLIEKNPCIGGHMAQLDKTFPTNDCSICILSPKLSDCYRHPRITIHTLSELKNVTRVNGNFNLTIQKKARFVKEKDCINCGNCVEKCPVKVEDAFDMQLRMRKAIYLYYLQGIPSVMAIDRDKCLFLNKGICKICEKICPKNAIDFEQKDIEMELNSDAIIVATGFDQFDPSHMTRYGYKTHRNVITGLEYERLLSTSGPTLGHVQRPSDKQPPKDIAFIQCVGSRDVKNNPYCSSVCCMYSTKQAILSHEHDNETKSYIYYIDLRGGGRGFQRYFQRAQEEYGVQYINGAISEITTDEQENPILHYEDLSTFELKSQRVDLVVLATTMIPSNGLVELTRVLNIGLDRHDFVETDVHNSLKTGIPGIFTCGCCHGPRDIPTSVTEASGAAAMAAEFIRGG
ncbi:MAG: 4Fe-4S dicluster domain-containing protein [Candidatus Helarchaeota archaeon]